MVVVEVVLLHGPNVDDVFFVWVVMYCLMMVVVMAVVV
jgi:hypothetical protein